MSAGPLKSAFGIAVVAFVAANFLAYRTNTVAPQGAANLSPQERSSPARRLNEDMSLEQARGYGRIELKPDGLGQYHAGVEIEGRRLAMLVDTGATLVALTYADAASAGLRPMPSDFKTKVSTANGVAAAAQVRLHEVRLETIVVDDVAAIVLPENITGTSLLGMSFLKRLGGFEIASGNLVLKP